MFGAKKKEEQLGRSELRQVVEATVQIQQQMQAAQGVLFQMKTLAAQAGSLSGSQREFDALIELIQEAGLALTDVYHPVANTRARWEERYEEYMRAGGDR